MDTALINSVAKRSGRWPFETITITALSKLAMLTGEKLKQ